jgi:hypothetical protein
MITAIIIALVVLVPIALVRRNFDFIKTNPLTFIMETLMIGILPALPFLYFIVSRGMNSTVALHLFYGFAIKFAAFHVLLEIAGYYKYELGT